MIIGLVGYHSSGKSVLAEFLEQEFGWRWVIKRLLFKRLAALGDDEEVWTAWYRMLYKTKNSYEIMQFLLREMNYDDNSSETVLLDAVHTPGEWKAIREVSPQSLLAGIFVPTESRLERSTVHDLVLDTNRAQYWHGDEGSCLLTQIEWSFCGTASPELRKLEATALRDHLVNCGRIR